MNWIKEIASTIDSSVVQTASFAEDFLQTSCPNTQYTLENAPGVLYVSHQNHTSIVFYGSSTTSPSHLMATVVFDLPSNNTIEVCV